MFIIQGGPVLTPDQEFRGHVTLVDIGKNEEEAQSGNLQSDTVHWKTSSWPDEAFQSHCSHLLTSHSGQEVGGGSWTGSDCTEDGGRRLASVSASPFVTPLLPDLTPL